MLLGITTQGKVGLGLLAGLFIAFALLSSFYFPRRDPNFPGNRLGLFTLVTAVLFLGTVAGVVFFAKEEAEAHETEAAETHGTEGDAAAGEAVYTSAGCGACHTLEAAGSSGAVGPNLDEVKPDEALIVERVTNGQGAMPPFKGQLDDKQIQDVAAYVVGATQR